VNANAIAKALTPSEEYLADHQRCYASRILAKNRLDGSPIAEPLKRVLKSFTKPSRLDYEQALQRDPDAKEAVERYRALRYDASGQDRLSTLVAQAAQCKALEMENAYKTTRDTADRLNDKLKILQKIARLRIAAAMNQTQN
jgi:hypothetical protein